MDPRSERIFCSANGWDRVCPASLTKMMTLILLFEEIQRNNVSLFTKFKVSARAVAQAPSKAGVKVGEFICVRDCISCLAVKSANDIAVVIAENLAGSVERFVDRMNAKAASLGMSCSFFKNPSGLPDASQKTSARDMAVLASNLWRRFSSYSEYFRRKTFCFKKNIFKNTNKLIGKVPGMVFGKTGYIAVSGFNLATVTLRGKIPVVVVVIGGKTSQIRDKHVQTFVETFYKSPRILPGLVFMTAQRENSENFCAISPFKHKGKSKRAHAKIKNLNKKLIRKRTASSRRHPFKRPISQ
ncbi:hypothetical protein HYD_1670 [Candidatus Hydrogenosomobacter endosymbioticus]|uniref:Peptidase S11 D-alanyl-D-alanine carboxypeptidase A N-terminal domain-containing protein n=2 Tax=Candidatus Hydrogenosomobacter endosymbioticus TaxID=2558174 RepID=A0ABM7V8E0_9PROT|nr:hypothetical protein HYD_1670 [Candidatus Hydrogenosomobacter endosymbioticus]